MGSKKTLFLLLGHLTLCLGVLGIFVPLLPTTPFVLLSAYFYSKGSKKFHLWLTNHAYFGPSICDWEKSGTIKKSAKITALALIAASIAVIVVVVNVSILIKGLAVSGCLGAAIFIATRPG